MAVLGGRHGLDGFVGGSRHSVLPKLQVPKEDQVPNSNVSA